MGPYVTMVVAIFLIVFAGLTIQSQNDITTSINDPSSLNQQLNTIITNFCYEPSADEVITFQAPQDQATKCPDGPTGSYKSGGNYRNKFTGTTTYKLIRKHVPLDKDFFTKTTDEHSTKAVDHGIQTSLDPSKYELYFPQITGEIRIDGNSPYSRTRHCGDKNYEDKGLIYFIDYGMAFGLVLENGKPVEVGRFYLMDVFQDITRAPVPQIAFDQCSMTGTPAPPPPPKPKTKVLIPNQQESTNNEQLQLSYFLFSTESATNQQSPIKGWVDTCKPAVYLYPPQKQLVNVKVYPKGYLTYTDPIYDLKNGWTVDAFPDGQIITNYSLNPKNYPYLYYESKIHDEVIEKPTKGWVIKSGLETNNPTWFNPLEDQFNTLLPRLGLNNIQTKDFIDYWKKALPYSPYYFIGVMNQSNIDQFESLEIAPKPDSVNRVRIYFERLTAPKQVQAPEIENIKFETQNSKFHVVEWGGMIKNDQNHPFTCSQ